MHLKVPICMIISIFNAAVTYAFQEMMQDVQGVPHVQEKCLHGTLEQQEYLHVRSKRSREPKFIESDSCSSSCGESYSMEKKFPHPIIINGTKAKPSNKYPWMVAMVFAENNTKFCGGAILNQYYILTAAHCLKKNENFTKQQNSDCTTADGEITACYVNPEDIAVAFLTSSPTEVTKGMPVQKIIPHHKYNKLKSNTAHDIGLVKMEKPIECHEYARPICLPDPSLELKEGQVLRISGWGLPEFPETELSPDLREARLFILDPKVCEKESPDFSQFEGATYCLLAKHDQGPCFGDSGGPAFLSYNDKFFAVGIASAHSSTECNISSPVFYTSVPAYMQWIKKHSGMEHKSMHGENAKEKGAAVVKMIIVDTRR